jgi:hypothetical protein
MSVRAQVLKRRSRYFPIMERRTQQPRKPGTIFVLGGNGTTLAVTSSFQTDKPQVVVSLLPLAWTPTGVAIGDLRQRVNVPADTMAGWLDQTFAPDDERSFIAPARDIDLLARIGWQASPPETPTEEDLLNPEDVSEDVLDAFTRPPAALTQCATCRRACVRDEFFWNERQLCAWDYHATVCGRRGPWRKEPYEDRHFDTLPRAAYVAAPLLEEIDVEPVLMVASFPEAAMRLLVNTAIAQAPGTAHLAARTPEGLTLLRELEKSAP